MTLNTTGPLSLGGDIPGQSIAQELGRIGTPISFSDADVRTLAGIPSGPISLSDFYGKSAGGGTPTFAIVTPLVNRSWYRYWYWSGSTSTALTWIVIGGDGKITCLSGSSPTGPANVHVFDDRWFTPEPPGGGNGGAGYFIRATLLAGEVPNGFSDSALDTWYDMGVSFVGWSCRAVITSPSQSRIRTMTLRIDVATAASDAAIVSSGTYDMTSECDGIA